jgi:Secretion system C-terminal sorting domain
MPNFKSVDLSNFLQLLYQKTKNMKIPTHSVFVLLLLVTFSFLAKAQLPYNCTNGARVAIAGDSWAQYMADDGSHNNIFRMYGQADKSAISQTFETPIGCPGSPGPGDYAVSGSEARQWADEANYDYLQNLIDALNAHPSVDYVMLSIGGNDILAAQSGGGWYKNMDLDEPGSEQALFDTITAHTQYIMDEVWARARPNINFIISSYDFPNFNVTGSFLGFDYCEQYACPKREDLSRDDNGNGEIDASELITDGEINAMMDEVEGIRKAMADSHPKIFYDNGMGLMHYYYGYDDPQYPAFPSGSTPHPQGESPYATGGDIDTPTDRENFRGVSLCGFFGSFPADPIHLDAEGYEYKIKNQLDNLFFENFRGAPDDIFWSVGSEDGYVDVLGQTATSAGIRVGDEDTGFPSLNNEYRGILSFNTEVLPDDAEVTGASLYMIRSSENDNPFFHTDRNPVLDIKQGYFGDNATLHWTDGTVAASATDIGCFHGQADENKWAIRVDLEETALAFINRTGTTQLRMYFDFADWSDEYINFYDGAGVAALLPPDEENRQSATQYHFRKVKKTRAANGDMVEEVIERGEPIEKREGFVYQEKLKDVYVNDDGDVIESYVVVVALEHPGLAKYMKDHHAAPADGYAPFLDVTYNLPLPVELIAFSAIAKNAAGLLEWETASEHNSQGFYVEHSINARDWEDLGFVPSAGRSSVVQQYHYLHENPPFGENYYRLRMLDLDGGVEFSQLRSLYFDAEGQLANIYPNPFSDELTLDVGNHMTGQATLQLSDVLGRILLQRNLIVGDSDQPLQINGLQQLSKGTYLVRLTNGAEVLTWTVVKR